MVNPLTSLPSPDMELHGLRVLMLALDCNIPPPYELLIQLSGASPRPRVEGRYVVVPGRHAKIAPSATGWGWKTRNRNHERRPDKPQTRCAAVVPFCRATMRLSVSAHGLYVKPRGGVDCGAVHDQQFRPRRATSE